MNLNRILVLCAVVVAASSAAFAKTIYLSTVGDDSNDGLTWTTAKRSLAGVSAIVANNDEIWVAKGTYAGTLAFPNLTLSVFGGFSGDEATKVGRKPRENRTIFTYQGIATSSPFYFRRANLDGIEFADITALSNYFSPAVTIIDPDSTIRACVFRNVNPGAVWVADDTSIENCIFTECKGRRVVTVTNPPNPIEPTKVLNCTFWKNETTEGLISTNHVLALHNNIFQGSLFSKDPLPEGSSGYGNCFWQVLLPAQWSWFPYLEYLEDSQLYEDENGTATVRPFSPCLNGGANQVVGASTDVNGNPRISGSRVDCGAVEVSAKTSHAWLEIEGISRQHLETMRVYEVVAPEEDPDGRIFRMWEGDTGLVDNPHKATARIVLVEDTYIKPTYRDSGILYVKPDGDDRQDGLSWATARRTIASAAISCSPRDKIYVAGGEYAGRVGSETDLWIEGGFDPETGLQNQKTTVIPGPIGIGTGVSSQQKLVLRNLSLHSVAASAGKLDVENVSLEGGLGLSGGLGVASEASIRRCQFVNMVRAVRVSSGSATIEDCDFVNIDASAIYANENAIVAVSNSRFVRAGYAVTAIDAQVELSDCLINSTMYDGIWAIDSDITAQRVKIFGAKEKAANISGSSAFRLLRSEVAANYEGIYTGEGVETVVAGCTIVDNYRAGVTAEHATATNNIVAYNGTGLSSSGTLIGGNNIVHGNSVNYDSISSLPGDVDADPAFALDRKYGDYRISSASPARDSASSDVIPTDITGLETAEGAGWDIGAREGVATNIAPRVVKVKPGAPEEVKDGASWATAYSTTGEAMADVVLCGGADIWTTVGNHEPLTMYPFAHVIGAFQGHEISEDYRLPTDTLTRFVAGANSPTAASVVSCSSVSSAYIEGGQVGLQIEKAKEVEVNNSIIASNLRAALIDKSKVRLLSNTIVGTTSSPNSALYLMTVRFSDFTFVNNAVAECQNQFQLLFNNPSFISHNQLSSDCSLSSLGGTNTRSGLDFWKQNNAYDKRYLHTMALLGGVPLGIDSGSGEYVNPRWRDVAGAQRVAGAGVGIGAREYGGAGLAPVVVDDGETTTTTGQLSARWSFQPSYLSPPASYYFVLLRVDTTGAEMPAANKLLGNVNEYTHTAGSIQPGYKWIVAVHGQREDGTPIHSGRSDGIITLGSPVTLDYYKSKASSLLYHTFDGWVANSSTKAGDYVALQNAPGNSGIIVNQADADIQAGDRIAGMIWRQSGNTNIKVASKLPGEPPRAYKTGMFTIIQVKPEGYPYRSGLDVAGLLMTLTGKVTEVVSRDPLVVTVDDGLGWWVEFPERTQRGITVRLVDSGPIDVGDIVTVTGAVHYVPTATIAGTNVFGRILQNTGTYLFPELLTLQPGRWELVGQ